MSQKQQAKFFLSPRARDALALNKKLNGTSYSIAVEQLIEEVLIPELREQAPELPLEGDG
jgi:hypothetical protein